MIIALLLFQALLYCLVFFELPKVIVIAIGFALVICIMIADARWEAIWSEIDTLNMRIEKLEKKNKK